MKTILLTTALIFTAIVANAQDPVEYMNQFTNEYSVIQQDMWDYTRTVSRGRSARKVEKRRMELISTVESALKKAERASDYEGDTDFRDAVVEYFQIIDIVLKEDYEKIVDMEEIAEQSYDAMEAYMMARDAASDKQTEAAEMVNVAQEKFAEAFDIELIASEDKLDEKMKIAGQVYDHYNEVFLIFFKSHKQEMYLLDAMAAQDISAIEQNGEALKSVVEADMEKLKSMSGYANDDAMIDATKELFKFYLDEVEEVQLTVDFFLKKERFEKIKENFDQIKDKNKTQEDVDEYNNAVNEMNEAAQALNESGEKNNKLRENLVNDWNSTAEKYTNKHVPRGK
ncbi:MAG: hypothetical protein NXI10_05335 [bacterium]|nr:hypothetical protein [bacterium]